ncbi:MAG TPA: NAD-dependent epimerase/dehydratase family protein, partial [Candidatus Nanopelagicales bacterium]|nr:NAD-dependent epimerase/dehydratase family protein [Candidatus Nanopelagicales bacterium]
MRIVLAGATGVIGIRMLPLLLAAGHQVLALTRREEKLAALRELGADPLRCDVYDADALQAAVVAYRPDLVVHQLTDLADDMALIDSAANGRMRTEGTANLLAAAVAAGVPGMLAQSIAWDGGPAVTEHERV